MARYRFFTLAVVTEPPFVGNPLAVVRGRSASRMERAGEAEPASLWQRARQTDRGKPSHPKSSGAPGVVRSLIWVRMALTAGGNDGNDAHLVAAPWAEQREEFVVNSPPQKNRNEANSVSKYRVARRAGRRGLRGAAPGTADNRSRSSSPIAYDILSNQPGPPL